MNKSFYDIKQDVYYRVNLLRARFNSYYKWFDDIEEQIIKIMWGISLNVLVKIDYKNRIVNFYRDNIHFSSEVEDYFKDIFSDKIISY